MSTNIATAGGARRFDRRRPTPPDQLPIETLEQMPALVVLERLPAPALAVDRAGSILFANRSFCGMLGFSPHELVAMSFDDIFHTPAPNDRWAALVACDAERLVELGHKAGHTVRASMSKSAMRRRDDTVALVTFHDRTEELWLSEDGWANGAR